MGVIPGQISQFSELLYSEGILLQFTGLDLTLVSGVILSGGYAPDSAKAEGSSIVDEPGEC